MKKLYYMLCIYNFHVYTYMNKSYLISNIIDSNTMSTDSNSVVFKPDLLKLASVLNESNNENDSNDEIKNKHIDLSNDEIGGQIKRAQTRKALKNAEKLLLAKTKKTSDNMSNIQTHKSNVINSEIDTFTINIIVTQRNGKKSTTTIENIPNHYFNDKDYVDNMLIELRNKIATRATWKFKDEENIIEFSGNKAAEAKRWVCKFTDCNPDNVIIHGIASDI